MKDFKWVIVSSDGWYVDNSEQYYVDEIGYAQLYLARHEARTVKVKGETVKKVHLVIDN